MAYTTWRKSIQYEMAEHGDSWENVVSCTMDDAGLDGKFWDGYGIADQPSFTVWTVDRVYFPVCYDGAQWAGSVARNPDGKPTKAQGGG